MEVKNNVLEVCLSRLEVYQLPLLPGIEFRLKRRGISASKREHNWQSEALRDVRDSRVGREGTSCPKPKSVYESIEATGKQTVVERQWIFDFSKLGHTHAVAVRLR
jgi:hypothetical protein